MAGAAIIVPYTESKLCPNTVNAVMCSGYPYRFVRLDPLDEGGYGRHFRRWWSERHTFVVCEHDVVPTRAQLDRIMSCGHEWCSFQYDDGLYPVGPMFGLARFDASVMVEHPYAAEVALVIGKRRDVECEWWRVDSMVARDLMIRRVVWHQHEPAVHHAHVGAPSGPA